MKVRKQCRSCPWLRSSSVEDIPGFSAEKAKKLDETVTECSIEKLGKARKGMACHCSEEGKEAEMICAGWASHQLGVGNNISLRLDVIRKKIDTSEMELVGEQLSLPEFKKKIGIIDDS